MNQKFCVSLEIAKEMEKAGWKKETEFSYVKNCNDVIMMITSFELSQWDGSEIKENYSAPLSDEILEELPDIAREYEFYIFKDDRGYIVGYGDDNNVLSEDDEIPFINKALPNAFAKMWLYLRKEKLI